MSDLLDDDESSGGGGSAWMATFADMMTLLLTFFVLLISFANMDVVKFQMMLGSVKEAMGVRNEHPGQLPALATTAVPLSDRESTDKLAVMEDMAIMNEMRRRILEADLESFVEAELGAQGVIVRVKGQVLFDLGSASVRPEGRSILDSIAQISHEFETRLLIEGHTDNLPISTSQFQSNWELSTARAISAMRYLVASDLVTPDRIGVAGYAEMRPLVPNDSAENRARNRRIEFVFVRMMDPPDADARVVDREGSSPATPITPLRRLEPIAAPLAPPELTPFSFGAAGLSSNGG